MIDTPQLIGLGVLGTCLFVFGWFTLRRQPVAVQLFALALALVGLGYLATTPAPTVIAQAIFGQRY